jgi:hypothetical protein
MVVRQPSSQSRPLTIRGESHTRSGCGCHSASAAPGAHAGASGGLPSATTVQRTDRTFGPTRQATIFLAFAVFNNRSGHRPTDSDSRPVARPVGERVLGERSRRVWPTAAPGGFLATRVLASRGGSRFLAVRPSDRRQEPLRRKGFPGPTMLCQPSHRLGVRRWSQRRVVGTGEVLIVPTAGDGCMPGVEPRRICVGASRERRSTGDIGGNRPRPHADH